MNEVKDRTDWTPQELAAEIATIIRERDELWNQGAWFSRRVNSTDELREALETDENVCGTTGCVAGWATALVMPPGTKITDGGDVRLANGLRGDAETIATIALGLDNTKADYLFSAMRDKDEVLCGLDAIAEGREWGAYEH